MDQSGAGSDSLLGFRCEGGTLGLDMKAHCSDVSAICEGLGAT